MSYASRNSSISLDGLTYMEPFTFMEESWKEVMEARIDDGSTRVWEGTTFGANFYRKLCMKPVYFLSEIRVSVSTWWDTFRAFNKQKIQIQDGPRAPSSKRVTVVIGGPLYNPTFFIGAHLLAGDVHPPVRPPLGRGWEGMNLWIHNRGSTWNRRKPYAKSIGQIVIGSRLLKQPFFLFTPQNFRG